MLDPNGRILLTEAIAAEPGYRLDHALFTSFTLDLTTLMEIPVALTFQEWKANEPDSPLSRIAVLDAIQRNVRNVTVVSQAGCITGPPKGHPLLPLLEPAIHPVVMPASSTFHPKVTLLRYLATPEGIDDGLDDVTYKLISSSRNLSSSRAWDTIVVLDGSLTTRKQPDAKGLKRFARGVAELAAETPTGIEPERAEALQQMAIEAPKIAFKRPEEVKDGEGNMEMVPIGFGKKFRPSPVRDDQSRLLISPFLGGGTETPEGNGILETFASKKSILVSRQNELDEVPEGLLERFGEVLVLSDLTQEAEEDTVGDDATIPEETPGAELRGLHAKLIAEDDGHNTRILIGSPNLSDRAFSQNKEFALRLTVSRYQNGVDKILGDDPKSGLRRFLQPYVRSEGPDEKEEEVRAAERSLEKVADSLVRAKLTLRIDADAGEESDHRNLRLEAGGALEPLPSGIAVEARPVSLGSDRLRSLDPDAKVLADWAEVPIPSITTLIAIRATTKANGVSVSRGFVIKAKLGDPMPEARDRLIVRRLIESSDQLLSYLAFLLAGSGNTTASLDILDQMNKAPERGAQYGKSSYGGSAISLPLVEKLVQAVDRDPEAIDSIASIVRELESDEEGREMLDKTGFSKVWGPVLEARKRRGEVKG